MNSSPKAVVGTGRFSRIVGTGSAHPERVMKNVEFESFCDTTDEWIRSRTGIEERRIIDATKGESNGSLALAAALKALEMADLPPSEVECIIVGTLTADSLMPCTANVLQAQLGAKRAFGFDLQAACSGWVYSLAVADQFVRSGQVNNALVVGVEALSTITNWRDRGTCILFGDGAGATVLRAAPTNEHAVLRTKLQTDGTFGEILKIPHGGAKVPPYAPNYESSQHKIQMQGSEVFKLACRNMEECSRAVLKEEGLEPKDVDFFLFHQANLRIVDVCMRALEVPAEKTWINLQKYGNTSAATLPIALDEAWKAGKVGPGSLVLCATFGGGLTWGSTLIRL